MLTRRGGSGRNGAFKNAVRVAAVPRAHKKFSALAPLIRLIEVLTAVTILNILLGLDVYVVTTLGGRLNTLSKALIVKRSFFKSSLR
jgi:hypothetical protein